MGLLGLALSAAVASLAAWKAFTATCALFISKTLPLPELPFASAAAAFTFCATMTLLAAVAHLAVRINRRKAP